ncbi:MAG: methionine aminopeptidase 2 [Amphiamblys sp. WSBS2006]|nr:MAG: methionine aminopeptidase 2 [Amphiamblys sp. WSBS2006]
MEIFSAEKHAQTRSTQTKPPSKKISDLFHDLPHGEIAHYTDRISKEEKKESERMHYTESLRCLRTAAEAHRQTRSYLRQVMKPGMKMVEICAIVENSTRSLIGSGELNSGIAFPTGCSLNNCAAHYTPNPGDETTLKAEDICKIDFGVHVEGFIVDSAFTVAFDPCYDPLVQASLDGTSTGVKLAGIDARLGEIGAAIGETIESYEMEHKGKTLQIKPIRNLSGHSIGKYKIHSGKTVPIVRTNDSSKMEEGELYAIETFASTGKGKITEDIGTSHYMRRPHASEAGLRTDKEKSLLKNIDKWFGTLPFCRRYLAENGETQHAVQLSSLVQKGVVEKYPPLCDIKNSFTSQAEHTIYLRPTCKEVLSRGDDY